MSGEVERVEDPGEVVDGEIVGEAPPFSGARDGDCYMVEIEGRATWRALREAVPAPLMVEGTVLMVMGGLLVQLDVFESTITRPL